MQKSLLFMFLLAGVVFNSFCQTMPTVREIYNFDVNDEFQYREYRPGLPTTYVTRYVITDKYYSASNDTVFYGRYFDNYISTYGYDQPEYYFNSYSDTTYVAKLDSLISSTFSNQYNDSCNTSYDTLYNASNFCGVYSYRHAYCSNCCFEPMFSTTIFGVGIGRTYHYVNYPSHWFEEIKTLFYFKKGDMECGEPDLLAVSVKGHDLNVRTAHIYPNPADNFVYFGKGTLKQNKVSVYNSLGKMVLFLNEYNGEPVNISSLGNGLYFVQMEIENEIHTGKFIINR
jgi:hypothetical protein